MATAEEVKEVSIGTVDMREYKAAREKGVITVEQKVAPVEEVEEKEEEVEGEEKSEEKPKSKGGGFQKRIDRLTKEARSERELRLAAEKRIAELELSKTETKTEKQADFDPNADFPDLDEWAVKPGKSGKVKDYLAERDAWKDFRVKVQQDQATQRELDQAYDARLAAASSKYEDWDDVLAEAKSVNLPVPEEVGKAIRNDMENGPDVVYFLLKHPEVREELMNVPVSKAIARAHRISEDLEAANAEDPEEKEEKVEEKAEEKVVKKEKAPPIKPVGGSNTKSTVAMDRMDMKAFKAARAAGRIS